jgi:disulfide bond formation protein DsbB
VRISAHPTIRCDDRSVATHHWHVSTRRLSALAAIVLSAALLAACGKSNVATKASSDAAEGVQRGLGVSASAVAVIKGWTDALRTGHPVRAASYWAHPSAMVNGPDASARFTVIRIHDTHDALIADETLSCGATLRGASRKGPYVEAAFTLGARTGPGASSAGCSGPALVDFLIGDGHIERWLRAPAGSPPARRSSPEKAPGSQSI